MANPGGHIVVSSAGADEHTYLPIVFLAEHKTTTDVYTAYC